MDLSGPCTENATNLCQLCNTRPRVYTCPRCGIGYCNVECYKSETHQECSESFYKQCVEEELKSQENDPEARKKMIEILKRVQEEELNDNGLEFDDDIDEEASDEQLDSDDEDVPNLEERLKNVNLDDADELWSALTNSERQEFEALIKNGEAEKLLPQWVPWWTMHSKKKLVQEIDEETVDYKKECPVLIDVPIFNELQKASPNVSFNIANVIYSYAYLALYYNGDYLNCAEEAATVFFDLCDNMKKNKVFDNVASAIDSVSQNIANCNWLPQDDQILLAFNEAGNLIIQGPEDANKFFYVSAALSELHRLLVTARKDMLKDKTKSDNKEFSKKFPNRNNTENIIPSKKTLLLCSKKIEYYLSWIKSYDENMSRKVIE